METCYLPLPEESFDNLNTFCETNIFDPKDLRFDTEEDQISTAIIYVRNLQLNAVFDFSNCDYKTKEKWLLNYLNADLILDNGIKQLDESILTILANEYIDLECILSQEEVKTFRTNNEDLVNNVIQFLVSLSLITIILEKNKDNKEITYDFYNGKIIEGKPLFYETLKHLITYYPTECDGIRLFFMDSFDNVLYKYVIDSISKEFGFYETLLLLPSVKFFGMI